MNQKSILSSLFLVVIVVMAIACSGNKNGDSASHDHEHQNSSDQEVAESSAPQFDVSKDFQNQLAEVFTSYNALKEAFVESDPDKVKSEAASTSQAVASVDMKLLEGQAHNDWMAYLTPINNALKQIEGSSDIEKQREAFSTVSDNLYKSIKAFGLGGKEAFYEYCPMAFNNEGAYWLSDNEKIRNPYFGDKMLNCGTVKERLR